MHSISPIYLFTMFAVVTVGCGEPIAPLGPAISADGSKADVVGNRPLNYACTWDWQCAADEGLVCRPTGNLRSEPEMRCTPKATSRGDCLEDTDCAAGYICTSLTDYTTGACVEVAFLESFPDHHARCGGDGDCSSGLVCRPFDQEDEDSERCELLSVRGGPCAEDADCVPGLGCDLSATISPFGRCAEF